MRLFGKKVKEVSALEMLTQIDKDVSDMAGKIVSSGDKEIQMIHMSGISNEASEEEAKGRCLAVIGSPEGLIEMLYHAGRKEVNFARILFSAAETLSNSTEKMAKLRDEVVLEVNGTCDCPACQAEAKGEVNLGGKSLNLNDLENMTTEQMDELVRGIMKDSHFGRPKQG